MKASQRIEEIRQKLIADVWSQSSHFFTLPEYQRKYSGGDPELTLSCQFKALFVFLDEKFPNEERK